MKIARVFPTRTRLSPDDPLAYFDVPDMFAEADEVHVSSLFTWDADRAEYLAEQWRHVAPVKLGGPGFGMGGAAFVPGMYVRHGATITSRGCPGSCWHCFVKEREPLFFELPICEGTNVLDNNLLACSERHIRDVFAMLQRQRGRIEFTGGLEAARLQPWHVDLLAQLRPAQMFFAWDYPKSVEPLRAACRMLKEAGFTRQQIRCYCLIGGPRDTFEQADSRLRQIVDLGAFPMAMLWRDETGFRDPNWMKFQRLWARPALIYARMKSAAGKVEGVQTHLTT